MKVFLVSFELLSMTRKTGFGFVSCSLARGLEEAGLLEKVVCLAADDGTGLPPSKIASFLEDRRFRYWNWLLAKADRTLPGFDARLRRELLFDRFVRSHLDVGPGDLVFFTRPLFLKSTTAASAKGARAWVQSSIPHPLVNFALVRNEELRLGLGQYGAYTNPERVARLARTLAVADRVVTLGPDIGRYTYETYRSMLGPGRLLPLRNLFSLSTEGFSEVAAGRRRMAEEDGVTFLHVSHINLIKGIPYLLEAWREFQKRGHSRCRLILAGSADRSTLDLMARDYRDLPRFEYRGFAADLAKTYGAADVFISPSISDNGPGTIVEAMAAGMPVVSSRNCGLASLIREGENGFTYDYNDPAGLVEIMERLAGEPGRIHDLGRRALQTVAGLEGNRYVDEILEFMRLDSADEAGGGQSSGPR
jgi:glycosyltransferase involved in cell wall biosynthesis